MINFTVVKQMDEEEWKDHVYGSGASTWDWWYAIYPNDYGDVIIESRDPDSQTYYSDIPDTYYTTLQNLADVASNMAPDYPVIASAINNSDFDADAMDLVLQMAAFGEIVYG